MWTVLLAEQHKLFRGGIKDMVDCIQSMFRQLARTVDPNSLQSLKDLLVSSVDRIRNFHASRMQGI
ncbi:hypothetical protein Slin15195_G044620 [Septoria linicola]|uniref:Uncharacterized protein n=1 Tax=Septoria linicola TaxID=215465 RepID=A0A9Q9AQA7_9PEZI|nr:hypothetical protein Slin14017_G048140 [Septoria linicola]USW51143.1 hypothetical protein Slin15195_G044620 [Septoria linicola]